MSLLIEVIEWIDPTGDEMIYRLPQEGSADFKLGAQLTVRDSQMALFFKEGKLGDTFTAGRYTLTSKNLPVLTRLLAFPFGFNSPFRAEVYFINLKVFTDTKWGTKHPVAFRDSKLGLIRLRGHGAFTMQIADPVLFLNTIVGRQARYTTKDVQSYLRDVIVARMNDMLGENLDSILDLPAIYTELAEQFKEIVKAEFEKYGLRLVDFYISSITPPDEVAKLIDQKSGLEAVGNLDDYLKFQLARGLGQADGAGSAGAGMGMAAGVGFMMPGMLAGLMQPQPSASRQEPVGAVTCPACGRSLPNEAKFCFECGHKLAAMATCPHCQAELIPGSRFCVECGRPVNKKSENSRDDTDQPPPHGE
jgi:membrane protease subunit (stomatin/prohibitin family)